MLLDWFLPVFQFSETHSIQIKASPGEVFACLKDLCPNDVPIIDALMTFRSIPAFLLGKGHIAPRKPDVPFIRQLPENGFFILGEESNKEVVLGIVGQFWRAAGNVRLDVTTPVRFLEFQKDGWAKAAWNFLLEPAEAGTRLVTQTRIAVFGTLATRKFGLYWMLIRGGSGLIRRALLKTVKRKAESF
jgi:hypothetical protein